MTLRFRYRTSEGVVEGIAGSPEELEAFELAIPLEPEDVPEPEIGGSGGELTEVVTVYHDV